MASRGKATGADLNFRRPTVCWTLSWGGPLTSQTPDSNLHVFPSLFLPSHPLSSPPISSLPSPLRLSISLFSSSSSPEKALLLNSLSRRNLF